jgi:hypothetical protein
MNGYFHDQANLASLQKAAAGWIGTPFMPNAAIQGAGVSCQKLIGALYIEAGFLPAKFEIPEGPMNWSHAHKDSLIVKFMAEPAQAAKFIIADAWQPGDMIGFHFLGCIQHCGVCIYPDGRFVHCLRDSAGVMYSNLRDAGYMQRIGKIWRPILF